MSVAYAMLLLLTFLSLYLEMNSYPSNFIYKDLFDLLELTYKKLGSLKKDKYTDT